MPINCFPTCMASLEFNCGFITPDEIKSLSTSPVQLAPPPGEGYINVLLTISMHLQFNSIPYQNGGDILVCLGEKDIFRSMTNDLVNTTADSFMTFHKPYSINYFNDADIINKPINIIIDSEDPDFTDGNSYLHYDIMYGAMPIHNWPY